MSSGSPRTRIDQFFPSRKRKPPSPCLKEEKNDKHIKNKADGSPSTKCSLEFDFVDSHGAGLPPKCATSDGGASLISDKVQRDLIHEINKATDDAHNFSSLDCAKGRGRESKNEIVEKPLCERDFVGEIGATKCSFVSRFSHNLVPGIEIPAKEEKPIAGVKNNLEHNEFVKDFLSLYCEEISTSAGDISGLPLAVQSVNICKRKSSSTRLSDERITCKKQCVSDHSQCLSEVGNASSYHEEPEQCGRKNTASSNVERGEGVEVAGVNRGKESKGKKVGLGTVLRKCDKTPNSGSGRICFQTPSSSASVKHSSGTRGWSYRGSLFSPGDEFWTEAIQVADGFAPKNECSIAAVCCTKNSRTVDSMKKHSKENMDMENGGPSLLLHRERSPLPVKHFDFSCDGKHLDGKTSTKCFVDGMDHSTLDGCKTLETGNLNCKGKQALMTNNDGISAQAKEDNCESPGKVLLAIREQDPTLAVLSGAHSTTASEVGRDKIVALVPKVNGIVSSDDMLLESVHGIDEAQREPKRISVCDTTLNVNGTPSSSTSLNGHLQLRTWLPSKICEVYLKKGISRLYPWQVECLQVDGVQQKRNLVYCASTSAGKSIVAEILMLRRVITTRKMALLVLPYVSLCSEKAEHLEALLDPLKMHVRSFYANQGGRTLPKDTSIAVCTIEKANSLINKLLEEGRLSEVGVIVIDELHMVGDQRRGYLLELMLTKLRYAAGEGYSEASSGDSSSTSGGKTDPAHGLQIIGMSATMPNVAAIADWLQAGLYETEFRPVPLVEYIKVGNTILNKKLEVVRTIQKKADLGGKDPDHIVALCDEIVQEGHSVLLFCSSRKGCETTARHVSKFLKEFTVNSRDSVWEIKDASSALEVLRKCPAGLDPVLEEILPSGVAYHHAGLTVEEREIVETCYRQGIVRVLMATSTLAAGVNLPARRVIFRQPRIGRDFIDGTRYKQMAGRAGRTGIDTSGESILICKPEEVKRISALLNDSCPPLQSCLSEDKNGMTHAILEVVAGGIVQTATDIHRYVRCTLLNSTKPFEDVVKSAQDSLRWLCQRKFLEWNEETKMYSTTPLGRATFGSSLTPEESLVVLDDLSRAREAFVLASDLHLVYLVTPINVDVEPDWELYYKRFMELSNLDQSVGNRVGVKEPFLMRMAHGAPTVHTLGKSRLNGRRQYAKSQSFCMTSFNNMLSDELSLRVCRRFYVALMLARLVQEVPVMAVCEAFKVARGMVQALQENAGRFALMVSVFCERLGWHDLEGLVSKFQNRVTFGVRAEIVELTTIPLVKGSRARALYRAGLRTPQAVAEASIPDIVKALFEGSSWAAEEGSAMRRMQFGVAKKIKVGARRIVLDQAEEARVAAFSAFKSLGLVPCEFPQAQLSIKAVDNVTLVDTVPDYPDFISHHSPDVQAGGAPSSITSDVVGEYVEDGKMISYGIGLEPKIVITRDKMINMDGVSESYSTGLENLKDKDGTIQLSGAVPLPTLDPNDDLMNKPFFPQELKNVSSIGTMPFGNSAGVLASQQEKQSNGFAPKYKLGKHCNSEKGPINAGSIPGGFDYFLSLWDTVTEFYFDVHFKKFGDLNSSVPFEIYGIAICWKDSPVYYVNIPKDLVVLEKKLLAQKLDGSVGTTVGNDSSSTTDLSDRWELANYRWGLIGKIMGKNGVRKVTWMLKGQIQALQKPGISLRRVCGSRIGRQEEHNEIELRESSSLFLPSIIVENGIDVCIVAWILWPDEESSSSPNLEKEVKKRLSAEAAAAANRDGRWRNQMHKVAHNGCCRRVAQTRALDAVLWKLLISEDLVEALTCVEMPLVKVLADIEFWGIGVDMELCLRARHILGKKLKELEEEAYSHAGIAFSLYGAVDIAHVLYKHLKLPIPESCNKGKHHPSTNKRSLELLRDQHPIVGVIKEHRTLAKLFNSTLGSICSRARLCTRFQKYKIQGHWLQTSTATGRLSMEDPNLQCVEHMVDFTIHSKDKGSISDHHQINARKFFIPTQDEWLLLTADYSQIELRLMAHFSKDPSLIELLSQPEGDLFTMIAARWTGQLQCAVSSEQRDQTKRLVYGILYGMGVTTLAEQLNCSSEEAAEKIQSFKSSFPLVSSWLQETVQFCRKKGYVETLKGRKRFLGKIKFGSGAEKAKAQRQAVNSVCQGSAADIIKIAMKKIHSVIAEGCLGPDQESDSSSPHCLLKGRCRIVLQVHDELVLEVDPSVLREAGVLLQTSMVGAVSLRVVDTNQGPLCQKMLEMVTKFLRRLLRMVGIGNLRFIQSST
ncbi:hypothetical protein AMTRI_Chr05g66280 [Amborella trichopoda]